MAYFYRLVCLFCLGILSFSALAVPKTVMWSYGALGPWYPTVEEACIASTRYLASEYNYSFTNVRDTNRCVYNGSIGNSQYSTELVMMALERCPAGSSDVGGACKCDSGVESGGQCSGGSGGGDADKCNGLQQWCTDKKGFSTLFKGQGQSADFFCHAAEKFIAGGGGGGSSWEPEFPGCEKGCMVIAGGTTVSVKDDAGQWWTEGSGKYVGSVCDPNVINKLNEGTPDEKEVTPPGTKDPGKCNGQSGTVNGVAVCLPYGEAEGDKRTDTTVNPDGTRTKTETVTKCDGSRCTTTTTTTKTDQNGNVSGGGSSTSTVPQGDYCARNPASSVCKALDPSKPPGSGAGGTGGTGSGDGGGGDDDTDKSSFGGSCAGGWTCEGDAIQCAVAREQHKRACELFEDRDNDAYRLYDKERDKEGSVLGSLKGNKDIDVSQYVNDRDDFIGSGSCPADKVIQFSYGEVSIPYSRLCPYLEMLGTVLIICAGIAGARIITRRDS